MIIGRAMRGAGVALFLGLLAACSASSGGNQSKASSIDSTTKPSTLPATTTTTTIAEALPAHTLSQGQALLTISDLGLGWATDPDLGMKSWVEDFTGGNCGGPNLAARSRGNSGVDVTGFEQDSTVGPFFTEDVVEYPTLELSQFAFHDTAFLSYQCGSWTVTDGPVAISDLPAPNVGSESVAKRLTYVAGKNFCNSGQVYEYDDIIEVRLRAQFIRFDMETAHGSGCNLPPAPPPTDAVLYALARKGVNKYEQALVRYTAQVYAAKGAAQKASTATPATTPRVTTTTVANWIPQIKTDIQAITTEGDAITAAGNDPNPAQAVGTACFQAEMKWIAKDDLLGSITNQAIRTTYTKALTEYGNSLHACVTGDYATSGADYKLAALDLGTVIQMVAAVGG